MANNDSNRLPYLIAAGAIGGAVGYLFFTDSGKDFFDKMARMRAEKTAKIPQHIENARRFIEKNGQKVTGRVRGSVDRLKDSMAAGQLAYEEAGETYQTRMDTFHRSNDDVVTNLHGAIDSLGRLFRTAQETMIDPFYEVGAIIRGVDRGVRQLAGKHAHARNAFGDRSRRMG